MSIMFNPQTIKILTIDCKQSAFESVFKMQTRYKLDKSTINNGLDLIFYKLSETESVYIVFLISENDKFLSKNRTKNRYDLIETHTRSFFYKVTHEYFYLRFINLTPLLNHNPTNCKMKNSELQRLNRNIRVIRDTNSTNCRTVLYSTESVELNNLNNPNVNNSNSYEEHYKMTNEKSNLMSRYIKKINEYCMYEVPIGELVVITTVSDILNLLSLNSSIFSSTASL